MVSWEIRTGPSANLRLGRLPVQPGRRSGEISPKAFLQTPAIQELLSGPTCPVRRLIPLITLLTATVRHVHVGDLPHQADTVTVDEQQETT